MRYVAAYLLAVLGGNRTPNVDDVKKILGSVGIEADAEKAQKVVKELNGKDINGVIAKGSEKLATVPTGGGAGAAAAAPAAAAAAPAAGSPKKDDKKAKKEESEEEDDDMGFGLFD